MADGKWIEGLTPEMSIAEAATITLVARFEVVRHYLPLATEKPYENPEYIHQLRVGSRRAGAALRVLADCLPRKELRSTRKSLRQIRRASGDARDWDVFLMALPESKALTSAAGRPALDFLSGFVIGERTAAQTRLVEATARVGPKFMEASAELPTLTHEVKCEKPPANFGELAVAQLGSMLAEFDEMAASDPREPAKLHRLRILGKRVRYAIEIFADCIPAAIRDAVYPAVEQLQELLGGIQDASVAIERLTALRDRARRAVPREWPRLQKGFEAQVKATRAKLPVGRRAFQKWRKEWSKLTHDLKLGTLTATITS